MNLKDKHILAFIIVLIIIVLICLCLSLCSLSSRALCCLTKYKHKETFDIPTKISKLLTNNIDDGSNNFINQIIDYMYPVNSVYISTDKTNPNELFKNTSWDKVSERFLYCAVPILDNQENNIGGSNKITVKNIPPHEHSSEYELYDAKWSTLSGCTKKTQYDTLKDNYIETSEGNLNSEQTVQEYKPPYINVFTWIRHK